MTVAAIARLSASVSASGDVPGTLVATVENGVSPATLLADVSRGLVNSCEATSIRTGFRVVLDGEEIPDADLVDYDLHEDLDTPVVFLNLNLIGGGERDYSVLRTLDTWTLVPVELYTVNGPPGAELERLRFAGYVRAGGTQQEAGPGGPGLTLKIACSNLLGRFGEFELCREIEPLLGLTRGAIMTELCADAGLTAVDFPDGEVYTKGIQAKSTRLLAFLQVFVEPEGWKLREIPRAFDDGGPVLTAYTPARKDPPIPADDIWDLSRLGAISIAPPTDVPSRWVARGYGAIFVDEHGQKTRVTDTKIWALYAPKVAINKQDTSGVISPTGLTPFAATLRMVQRIIDTLVSRGGKPISQETVEYGFYNPKAAYKHTSTGAYIYNDVKIDETGEFVLYPFEKFMEVGRRKFVYTYDGDGNAVGGEEFRYYHYLRTEGITIVGGADIQVDGAQVYGDENSYLTPWETYGYAERHSITREFDDETGAELQVTTKSYGYTPTRSYIAAADNPAPDSGYYVRSDGKGQKGIVANWTQFAEANVVNIVVDGMLQGTIERKQKLDTYRMLQGFGFYQWGDYDSNYKEEKLILAEVKAVQYNLLSDDTFERVTFQQGADPKRELVNGRVPQPRYKTSAWTYLRQEPIELVVDDAVVQELLGFRREVVQNDHIQSLEEAQAVIDARRRRAMTYSVRFSRHESHLGIDSTVLLKHPDHGLLHRGHLVDQTLHRSRVAPAQTADYEFEVAW